ncbi:MAG: LytR C-terminal domain-containing protein, partial [Candidatus Curtissbacteria bacterium]
MDDLQQSSMSAGNPTGPIYQESQDGKNAKWLWLLIALIIIGALAFAFVRGIGPFGQFRGSETVDESPMPESFVSSPSPEATSAAEVDKSTIRIRVLNGSGKAGAASAAKDFLEGLGYVVPTIGNAANNDFAKTVITFKASVMNIKDILVSDLSDEYSVTVSDDSLEATDSVDVEVILGAQ